MNFLSTPKIVGGVIIGLLPHLSSAQISVHFPTTRTVFQRNNQNEAVIQVRGNCSSQANRVEARLIARDSQVPTTWQTIDYSIEGGNYSGGIRGNGGWYDLEVRSVSASGNVMESLRQERIGVGEVFIVAGHSVAHGDAQPAEGASDDRVNHIFQPDNPLYNSTGDPQFLSNPPYSQLGSGARPGPWGYNQHFWGLFGQHIAQRLNVPVLIFNAAFGGTSLEHWAKSAQGLPFEHSFVNSSIRMPYINVKNTLTKYIREIGVRGILSDNGQNDNDNPNVGQVLDYYRTWINQARADLGYGGLAVVVNRQTPWLNTDPRWNVRQVQDMMSREPNCFAGPDYDTGIPSEFKPDQVHLNVDGKRRAAQLWADAVTNTGFLAISQPWLPGYQATGQSATPNPVPVEPSAPTPAPSPAPQQPGNAAYQIPEGYLDQANCDFVAGWAIDRSRKNVSINVDIYVNGQFAGTVAADRPRPDIGRYLDDNGLHGFYFEIPDSFRQGGNQQYSVRFSGSNKVLSNGDRMAVGCGGQNSGSRPGTSVPARENPGTGYQRPQGHLDLATCGAVSGWAADLARPNTSIAVDIYVDGRMVGTSTTDRVRSDVAAYIGDNGRHGFYYELPAEFKTPGQHTVFVRYAGSSEPLTSPSKQYVCYVAGRQSAEPNVISRVSGPSNPELIEFRQYPNPVHTEFDVVVPQQFNVRNLQYIFRNAQGQALILPTPVVLDEHSLRFQVGNITPGLYFMQIRDGQLPLKTLKILKN